MAEVLNRMGFPLCKVVKAKPQKKIKETDAIFDNITDLPPWKRSNSLIPKGNIKRHSGYMEPPFVFIRLWYSDVPFRSIQVGGFLVATSRPSSIRVTD